MPVLGSVAGKFGFGRSEKGSVVKTNLLLYLDAANLGSYPGSGTTWTDLSPNANNATSLTGVTYSSSNGGILTFNGSTGSGSLDTAKYNTTYSGKTVFVAGRLDGITTGTYRALLGSSAGNRNFNFYFYSPSNSVYQFHYSAGGTGSYSSNLSYTVGNWFTAAYTHATDGTVKYYLNGSQVSQTTQTFTQYGSSTEHVGRADNFWNGPLGVVSVYKSALSAADILANHNAVKTRYGL